MDCPATTASACVSRMLAIAVVPTLPRLAAYLWSGTCVAQELIVYVAAGAVLCSLQHSNSLPSLAKNRLQRLHRL